jgi:hypothetical protein
MEGYGTYMGSLKDGLIFGIAARRSKAMASILAVLKMD